MKAGAHFLQVVVGPIKRPVSAGEVDRTDRSVGDEIHRSLEGLLAEGRIRPVVGREISHLDLPSALDDMERRLTTGRTVVMW